MKPERIQLSRKKGWRMPPNTAKCDRTTLWGNPFRVQKSVDLVQAEKWCWAIKNPQNQCIDAQEAVDKFRYALAFDDASKFAVRTALHGKNLACWCQPDQPCHVDVLLEVANK